MLVRDPAVTRGAVAREPGTTVVSVGGSETGAALEHLRAAVEARPSLAGDAQADEELEPLRGAPRFPPPPAGS